MTDPDQNGNKTVFRPSPLQALKNPGQPAAPPPLPIAPPPPPPPPPPLESTRVHRSSPGAKPAARPTARRSGGRTALIVLFVAVTLLAIGYVAVQLTTGAAPTLRLSAAATLGTAA